MQGRLASNLRVPYATYRVPETISLLDWSLYHCWSPQAQGLDRSPCVSVYAELLYHLSRATRCSCKIHLHQSGSYLVKEGRPYCSLWTSIFDMASTVGLSEEQRAGIQNPRGGSRYYELYYRQRERAWYIHEARES